MALSINYPIDAYEIFGVRRLSPGHPVYLLSGPDLSKLVVKQEMVGFQAGKKEAIPLPPMRLRSVPVRHGGHRPLRSYTTGGTRQPN